jgi:hypothetical protein
MFDTDLLPPAGEVTAYQHVTDVEFQNIIPIIYLCHLAPFGRHIRLHPVHSGIAKA